MTSPSTVIIPDPKWSKLQKSLNDLDKHMDKLKNRPQVKPIETDEEYDFDKEKPEHFNRLCIVFGSIGIVVLIIIIACSAALAPPYWKKGKELKAFADKVATYSASSNRSAEWSRPELNSKTGFMNSLVNEDFWI